MILCLGLIWIWYAKAIVKKYLILNTYLPKNLTK
jgi:hypothetical protein